LVLLLYINISLIYVIWKTAITFYKQVKPFSSKHKLENFFFKKKTRGSHHTVMVRRFKVGESWILDFRKFLCTNRLIDDEIERSMLNYLTLTINYKNGKTVHQVRSQFLHFYSISLLPIHSNLTNWRRSAGPPINLSHYYFVCLPPFRSLPCCACNNTVYRKR